MNNVQVLNLKPTHSEYDQLNEFIKRAVYGNLKFEVLTNKAAISQKLGIQDILQLSATAIADFGEKLELLARKSTNSKFKKAKVYYTGDVTVEELVDIMAIVMKKREYDENHARNKQTLAQLEAELDTYKTDGERKEEILAKIHALKG